MEALLNLYQSNELCHRGHCITSNDGLPTEGFKVVVSLFKETRQHLVSLLGNAKVTAGSRRVEKMSPHVLVLCI